MKLSKFSKLAGFLSIAIIGSSLLTIGCSRFNNQSEEKTVEDKSKEKDSLIANMDSATVFERCKLYYSSENYTEAFKCFQKVAEQGYAPAQCNLGYMYQYGRGVKQDYFKAVEWYQKAADQGQSDAQFNLGLLYYDGEGVRQNYTKAKEYFGLACDNKDQDGCDMYKKLNQ